MNETISENKSTFALKRGTRASIVSRELASMITSQGRQGNPNALMRWFTVYNNGEPRSSGNSDDATSC